jgi:hypothetical protein
MTFLLFLRLREMTHYFDDFLFVKNHILFLAPVIQIPGVALGFFIEHHSSQRS